VGRDAAAGSGAAGTFAGTSTFPCFAFVQLASDGLDDAAAPARGTTQTARVKANKTSRNDSRSKIPMINRFRASSTAVCLAHGPGTSKPRSGVPLVSTGERQPCDRRPWPDRLVPEKSNASKSARCASRCGRSNGSRASFRAVRPNNRSTLRRHPSWKGRRAPRPAFSVAAISSCAAIARRPRRAASCVRSRSPAAAATRPARCGSGSRRRRRID
jgi:hypothetical protein